MNNTTLLIQLTEQVEYVRAFVEKQHLGIHVTSVDIQATINYPFILALYAVDIPVPGTIRFHVHGAESLESSSSTFIIEITPDNIREL